MKYVYEQKPLTISTNSTRFINEVLVEREYAPMLTYNTVIDAGANIGTFSLFIYPFAKTIWAIEPDSDNIKLFKETIEENGLTNIHIEQLALGNYDGEGYIDEDIQIAHGGNWQLNKDGSKLYARTCTVKTLATFIKEHNIEQVDLLKLDVEGEEERILRIPDFASIAPQIKLIIGEVHSTCSVREVLEQSGYKYEEFSNNHFKATR